MDTKRIVQGVQHTIGAIVTGFSGLIVVYGTLREQSNFNKTFPDIPLGGSIIILLGLLIFVGMLEGIQVAILQLQRLPGRTFKNTYPRAYKVHQLCSGANLKNTPSFVVGRQMLVLFSMFFVAKLTSFPNMVNIPFSDTPWPKYAKAILIDQGILSVPFFTCVFSLAPQVVATNYPVQFMSIPMGAWIFRVSMWIDEIGINHAAWLIAHFVGFVFRANSTVTDRLVKEEEVEKNPYADEDRLPVRHNEDDVYRIKDSWVRVWLKKAWYYFRYTYSTILLFFSVLIVFYGVLTNRSDFKRTFPEVHEAVAFLLLVFFLFLLFLLEGSQVCIVDLSRHTPDVYQRDYPRAARLSNRCSGHDAVSRYLIGRQLIVIICVFVLSNLTNLPLLYDFPWSSSTFQEGFRAGVLETGLLGGLLIVILSQLSSRLVAIKWPVQFLNLPGLPIIVWMCWIVEGAGLLHFSWVCGKLVGSQMDPTITSRVRDPDSFPDEHNLRDNYQDPEDIWKALQDLGVRGGRGRLQTGISLYQLASELQSRKVRLPKYFLPHDHVAYVPAYVIATELLQLIRSDADRELAQLIIYKPRLLPAPESAGELQMDSDESLEEGSGSGESA